MTNQDVKLSLGKKIEQLAIVLVRPASAEHVGYTARLMSTFSVERGVLVAPSCDINSLDARRAASGQGAMRLATMQTVSQLRDAVKTATNVIAMDAPIKGKGDISIEELGSLVAQSNVALVWFSDHKPCLPEEALVITHNLYLPKSKLGPPLPTSHSVGICLAQIFADLKVGD